MATTEEVATTDEIERRVEEADATRHAKRSAAAQQVGELAARRAVIAGQLGDIEGQLGNALAAAHEVMDIDELARFTDVPAADLTRWLTARKPARTKRKKPAAGVESDTSREPSAARTPAVGQVSTPPASAAPRSGIAPARVPCGGVMTSLGAR
ncbi:hypothetical protein [Amycolatopsis sp. H20-H5]|uniref:hypothetical protein n=1 Tax=Amycolatopsis sp. H20-H5 TaxID=3046309 RepID=UPI002DBAEF4E|nr:hypothetical protein [Amycolatopsis sp. H20-H5]MEC3974935.1 hypothetical protein [Amycolatopsis sp. H20-H5]